MTKGRSWAFSRLLLVKHHAGDLCCTPVVVQIKKRGFPKHTAVSWRSTWKVNGLHLKPQPCCGACALSPCCHVGSGAILPCSGGGPVSSQLLRSAAADPAAFLLHYPDVGIVDAFSLCPSVWFKGYFRVSKGKGLSPPSLSKYSLLSKYSVVWLWNYVQLHCYKDLNGIQTEIFIQFGEKMIKGITGFSW